MENLPLFQHYNATNHKLSNDRSKNYGKTKVLTDRASNTQHFQPIKWAKIRQQHRQQQQQQRQRQQQHEQQQQHVLHIQRVVGNSHMPQAGAADMW